MKKEPLTELGENYEYLRTIVNNKIELLKLDAVESGSRILGYLILLLVVSSFVTLILGLVSCLLVLVFTELVDSMLIAITLTIAAWTICIGIAYLFRKHLFYQPLSNFILTKFTKDDSE